MCILSSLRKKKVEPTLPAQESAPQVVKVEFAPLPAQVVEVKLQQEKDPIDWNVFGVVSAAFTLLATAIFFAVGWSYEANWYGYYGINLTELNLPVEQILVQSFPPVMGILVLYGLIVSVYLVFNVVLVNIAKKRGEVRKDNTEIHNWDKKDWNIVSALFLWIAILSATVFYAYLIIRGSLSLKIPFELSGLLIATYAQAFFWQAETFQSGNNNSTENAEKKQLHIGILIKLSIFLLSILMFAVSFAVLLGINDASNGERTYSSWNAQPFDVVTSKPIEGIEASAECKDTSDHGCIYGPYSLVAENANQYYLVKWAADQNYKREPGLFILPKNREGIILVDDTFLLLPPLPTITPVLTIIPTLTLTPTVSPAPTSTPKPGSTH